MVELLVVVLILAVLTCLAVPRLRFDAVSKVNAEAVARRISMDLRLARSRAILQAVQSPAGCALTMTGSEPYRGYDIVDLGDSNVIASHDLPAGVRCTGGRRFEFSSLGELKEGSDTQLQVSSQGRTLTLSVLPATGTVKCL
jgi:type II secretory pathway pseudopilin PulG